MSAILGTTAERVLDMLAGDRPLSFAELCTGSGVAASRMDNVVAALVRHRYVRRLHNADGIMRYERARVRARAASIASRTRDAVIAVMAPVGEPMRFSEIAAALRDRCSASAVHNCLERMRDGGYVEVTGRNVAGRWRLTEAGRSLLPPSPGIARPDAATGPATVVPHSPASSRTPAAAAPHAAHEAAPENPDALTTDWSRK